MTTTKEQLDTMVATMSKTERQTWIQDMGLIAWVENNYRGTMEMATGTGKTRIGIRAAARELERNPQALVYIVVPTETLRDVDWPNEIRAYGADEILDKVRLICWASLAQEKPERDVDLIVLDEVHHLTILNSLFFNQAWKVFKRLGLTATLPTDRWESDADKLQLINYHCPSVFKVTVEEAIALKIVTDFKITVLMFDLDDTNYYVDGGSKKKPFKTTEAKQYKYLTRSLQRATFTKNDGMKFAAIQKRTAFLMNLRSKVQLAKEVIAKVMTNNERTIIFCGGIEQSEQLCGKQVYNSTTSSEQLELFTAEKISYLGVVQALNEGKNVPSIDQLLIVQLNSKELNLIQRIGRAIRWREDHTPNIIILVAKGTADEKWYRSATENINKSRIKEHYVRSTATTSS